MFVLGLLIVYGQSYLSVESGYSQWTRMSKKHASHGERQAPIKHILRGCSFWPQA